MSNAAKEFHKNKVSPNKQFSDSRICSGRSKQDVPVSRKLHLAFLQIFKKTNLKKYILSFIKK